jgi:hypothetical protein
LPKDRTAEQKDIRMEKITKDLIASCGMNCGLCAAYLRKKNPCSGCRNISSDARKTILFCELRICTRRSGEFCYDCNEFPCTRLKHLDKRYRQKYGMSEIENLDCIRDRGIEEFLAQQREKWQSEQGILCVHDRKYYP